MLLPHLSYRVNFRGLEVSEYTEIYQRNAPTDISHLNGINNNSSSQRRGRVQAESDLQMWGMSSVEMRLWLSSFSSQILSTV